MKPIPLIIVFSTLVLAVPVLANGFSPDPATWPPATRAKFKARQDKLALAGKFSQIGQDSLSKGQYASAEVAFRAAVQAADNDDDQDTSDYAQLAHTLILQGRPQEALTIYRKELYRVPSDASHIVQGEVYAPYGVLSSCGSSESLRACMEYAILASKIGSWPEAAYVFRNTLASMLQGEVMPKIDVQFDANQPEPERLQAAAHVVAGIEYLGTGDNKEGMAEFDQAHKLEPNWSVATVYYAYGLQRTTGFSDKTKAAYHEAADTGSGDVKAFAERYLQMYP